DQERIQMQSKRSTSHCKRRRLLPERQLQSMFACCPTVGVATRIRPLFLMKSTRQTRTMFCLSRQREIHPVAMTPRLSTLPPFLLRISLRSLLQTPAMLWPVSRILVRLLFISRHRGSVFTQQLPAEDTLVSVALRWQPRTSPARRF